MDFTLLPNQFDRTPEERSYEPLPKGWYIASLVEVEDTPTKGGGLMDSHTWEIIADASGDPKYQGRQVVNRLNIVCTSTVAEDIARSDIKAIAFAVRAPIDWTSSEQFIGYPARIKLAIEAATDQYEAKNTVKGYARYESGQAVPVPTAPIPAPAHADGTAFPFGANAPTQPTPAPAASSSPLPFMKPAVVPVVASAQPAPAPAPAPGRKAWQR